MKILETAVSGTLESSDVQVIVSPSDEGITVELQSSVLGQYGHKIKEVILETLSVLDIADAHIAVVDKGALDCTIRARVESAVYRGAKFDGPIPWGGVKSNG